MNFARGFRADVRRGFAMLTLPAARDVRGNGRKAIRRLHRWLR